MDAQLQRKSDPQFKKSTLQPPTGRGLEPHLALRSPHPQKLRGKSGICASSCSSRTFWITLPLSQGIQELFPKGYPMERSLSSCSVLEVMGSQRPQYFRLVMLWESKEGRISGICRDSPGICGGFFPVFHLPTASAPPSDRGTDSTRHERWVENHCTHIWLARKLSFR